MILLLNIALLFSLNYLLTVGTYFFQWFQNRDLYNQLEPFEISRMEVIWDESQGMPNDFPERALPFYEKMLTEKQAYAILEGGELALDGSTIPIYYGLGAASDVFQMKPEKEEIFVFLGENVSGVKVGNVLEIPMSNGDYSIPITGTIPAGKKVILHNRLIELDQGIYVNLPFDVFQEVTARTSSSFFSYIELPNDLRFIDLSDEE